MSRQPTLLNRRELHVYAFRVFVANNEKKRGFADQELREVCERIAGTSLAEFFEDYVNSTNEVDFAKYFAYAGLKPDTEPRASRGAYLGADTANNGITISRVEIDSPARASGLSAQDQILAVGDVALGTKMGEKFQNHAGRQSHFTAGGDP